MLRAIREIQPRWVVGENVRGLTNWNGGLVFDEVQSDLENEGYEVLPFLLPACAVDAPHRRDRIWFVAHAKESNDRRTERKFCQKNGRQDGGVLSTPCSAGSWDGGQRTAQNSNKIRLDGFKPESQPCQLEQREFGAGNDVRISDAANARQEQCKERGKLNGDGQNASENEGGLHDRASRFGEYRVTAHSSEARHKRSEQPGTFDTSDGREQPPRPTAKLYKIGDWQQFPTQSPLCSRNDGVPAGLDGITFPKWREFSIGAYGNAIVPQVAYQIFQAIQKMDNGQ